MNNDLRPITTLPPFKRMWMTIGELPTSYLETMTYYEMLVWFTEYMKNTIIPTINNNGLAVQELQDKYIELKTFVDNYFDNLDVQEEINNKLDEMVEDGTFQNLLNAYFGDYIFIDTIPGIKKYDNLEDAQNDNTSTNAQILNELTLSGINTIIFGKGYYPFENHISLKNMMEIYSLGTDTTLVFNNSDGLVTDTTGYFQNILIHNINIISKGYCINFKNDNITFPNSIHTSKFYDLYLTSNEQSCIYAGDNIGIGNTPLTFNLAFDRIKLQAPNGDGIVGFGTLITTYNEISDFGNIINIFRNCSGKWTNCNTSFAHAEWFLYDDNMANLYNYIFEFINCNFENIIKGALYFNNNTSGINNIIIEDCRCYVDVEEDNELLNIHPVTFKTSTIEYMTIKNFGIGFTNGKTWTDVYSMAESEIHTNNLSTSQLKGFYGKFNVLSNTTLMAINNEHYTYQSYVGNGSLSIKNIKELHSDAFVGGRTRNFYSLDMSVNRYVNFRNNSTIYDGIILTNASTDTVLSYIYPNNVVGYNQNGMIFTIINSSGHNVTLNATTGYQQNYEFLDSAETKVLANGDVMACVLIMIGNVAWLKELFTKSAS